MREMNKSHWAESYIGRPYVEGRHDCADFVAAVMREHFGRELTLPAHGAGTRAWDRQIAALKGVYAVHVAPEARGTMGAPQARGSTVAPEARGTMGTPREGDGVLMAAAARRHSLGHHRHLVCRRGRALRASLPHIGIWCAVAGEPYVTASKAWARSCIRCAISTAARSCSKACTDGDNRPVARPCARGK